MEQKYINSFGSQIPLKNINDSEIQQMYVHVSESFTSLGVNDNACPRIKKSEIILTFSCLV